MHFAGCGGLSRERVGAVVTPFRGADGGDCLMLAACYSQLEPAAGPGRPLTSTVEPKNASSGRPTEASVRPPLPVHPHTGVAGCGVYGGTLQERKTARFGIASVTSFYYQGEIRRGPAEQPTRRSTHVHAHRKQQGKAEKPAHPRLTHTYVNGSESRRDGRPAAECTRHFSAGRPRRRAALAVSCSCRPAARRQTAAV